MTATKGTPPTLQHNILHLAKYVGELAMIAEDADHTEPEKRRRAALRADQWINGPRAKDLQDHLSFVMTDLHELAQAKEPVDPTILVGSPCPNGCQFTLVAKGNGQGPYCPNCTQTFP